jgi:hypothetical protein
VVLLVAVLAGLIAGLLRAWITNRQFALPELQAVWLVPLAFIPQWLVFSWPPVRDLMDETKAPIVLVGSLLLLLIFAWANRQHRAFWLLGLGLFLNLLVIVLNGGLMPVSPEMVRVLLPNAQSPEDWQPGHWLRGSKDIVLPEAETRLVWLSDRLLLPDLGPLERALSLGDVLISVGVFWLLWQAGGPPAKTTASQHLFLSKSSISSKEDV